jgi:protein involved in polysaccharide export with SLBB domain
VRLWLLAAIAMAACSACTTGAARPAYPLHPFSRPAAGGPVAILGAVERPCTVPYAPGLTLRAALKFAGGPSELGMRDARITRGGQTFDVPVQAIVAGDAPDLELAPGDQILVESARISDQ